MKTIRLSNTTTITRAGAYLRFDRTDTPATEELTPTIIESRWIDPDVAALMLSQAGKYDELKDFFIAWHKLPISLRAEWIKSQKEQNPYGGIMPGPEETESVLQNVGA